MAQTMITACFFNDLNNFSSYDVILGGDFNLILNNDLDKISGAFQCSNYKAREVVCSHMLAINLSDSFCIFHPFMKTFTRIQITPYTASKLNFFLVSNSLTSFTQIINVLPSIRSDHRVVKLVLRFLQFNIGPGYWKFNNDLLDDDNYMSFIKQVITDYKSNNPEEICTPQIRWDALKCVIRGYTIQYSSQKQRRMLMKQMSLEQKMQLFQNLLSYCLPNVREKLIENIQSILN